MKGKKGLDTSRPGDAVSGVRNATETAIGRQKRDKTIKWSDTKQASDIPRWQESK